MRNWRSSIWRALPWAMKGVRSSFVGVVSGRGVGAGGRLAMTMLWLGAKIVSYSSSFIPSRAYGSSSSSSRSPGSSRWAPALDGFHTWQCIHLCSLISVFTVIRWRPGTVFKWNEVKYKVTRIHSLLTCCPPLHVLIHTGLFVVFVRDEILQWQTGKKLSKLNNSLKPGLPDIVWWNWLQTSKIQSRLELSLHSVEYCMHVEKDISCTMHQSIIVTFS